MDYQRIVVFFERTTYVRYLERAYKEGKDMGRVGLDMAEGDVGKARVDRIAFKTGFGVVGQMREARFAWTLRGRRETIKDGTWVMRAEEDGVLEQGLDLKDWNGESKDKENDVFIYEVLEESINKTSTPVSVESEESNLTESEKVAGGTKENGIEEVNENVEDIAVVDVEVDRLGTLKPGEGSSSSAVEVEMIGVVVSDVLQVQGRGCETVRDVYRRAAIVNCPKEAVVRMKWAQFEENVGYVEHARDILEMKQASVLSEITAVHNCTDTLLEQLVPYLVHVVTVDIMTEESKMFYGHPHGNLALLQLLLSGKPIKAVCSLQTMTSSELSFLLADPRDCHIIDIFITSKTRENMKNVELKLGFTIVMCSQVEDFSTNHSYDYPMDQLLVSGDIHVNPGPGPKTLDISRKVACIVTQNIGLLSTAPEVDHKQLSDFVFGESDSSDNDSIQVELEDAQNDLSDDSIQDYEFTVYEESHLSHIESLETVKYQSSLQDSHPGACLAQQFACAGKETGGGSVMEQHEETSVLSSSSDIPVKPPSMRVTLCSKYCKKNCYETLQSWSKELVSEFKSSFYKKTIFERKKALLSHLKKQCSMGIKKRGVLWNSHLFCLKYFSQITSISMYLINTVMSDHFKGGIEQYVHGNSKCPKERPATINFISFMVQHVEIFGQDSPDAITKVMSSVFKRKELYQTYLKETQPPHIKLSTFYSHLKEKFGLQRNNQKLPNVKFSKYSSHSRCDTCTDLDQLQRTSKNEEKLRYCQHLKFKHRERFGKARQAIANLRQLSLSFPSDYLMISCDDMDNSKSLLPRIVEPGKKLSGCYKIPTKLTGTISTSGLFPNGRRVAFFYNHDEFPNGSNKLVSVLFKLIQGFLKEFKFLPKHLYLSLDNCFKENKNRQVSG